MILLPPLNAKSPIEVTQSGITTEVTVLSFRAVISQVVVEDLKLKSDISSLALNFACTSHSTVNSYRLDDDSKVSPLNQPINSQPKYSVANPFIGEPYFLVAAFVISP